MSDIATYPTVELHIDQIRPYWRNPRRVTDEAVNALRASIENYGYNQPLVVDEDNVLIIGHTRYSALRRMDVTMVPVKVAVGLPHQKVQELRVIDNRVAELTGWDFNKLTEEIADMDGELIRSLFPEINTDGMFEPPVVERPEGRSFKDVDLDVEFVCTSCFHTFQLTVDPQKVMAGKTLKAEA